MTDLIEGHTKSEPVAYILFSENGNVRMFSRDRQAAGPDAMPVYLHQSSGAARPFGYAYRYWDCIRFDTGGREINGSKPTETIPLYTHSSPAAHVTDAVQNGIAMAIGWMFQEAVTAVSQGKDLRKMDQSDLLERGLAALTPREPQT
jgi:hypothetical protein